MSITTQYDTISTISYIGIFIRHKLIRDFIFHEAGSISFPSALSLQHYYFIVYYLFIEEVPNAI